MFNARVTMGSTLFLVLALFGLLTPCQSRCTDDSIKQCYQDEHRQDYCQFYRDLVKCLEEVKSNCTDDRLITKLTHILSYRRPGSLKCPGMTADCMLQAKMNCYAIGIPINVRNVINYPMKLKLKECNNFKGKEDNARQCFNDIKAQCNSGFLNRTMNFDLKLVDGIQDLCDKLTSE